MHEPHIFTTIFTEYSLFTVEAIEKLEIELVLNLSLIHI